MKRFLLVILSLMITFSAFSQMGSGYNYSTALRGYDLAQMPRMLNDINSNSLTNVPLHGIMVKFNDNQISYRLNGTYYRKSKSFYNNCQNCELADGKLIDYSFKIGFEKNFNYARIQPYFAFDFGYRASRFSGEISSLNQLQLSNKTLAVNTHVETSKDGLVLSPVFGIKVSPVEKISLFIEANMDFFYSYERQERIKEDIDNTSTFRKFHKSEFLFNPVSIGVQIHLGSNN